MRIGILQTDTVSAPLRARHGDYPQMFADLFRAAADGAPVQCQAIDALQGAYPSPEACDAYLITGSRHSVYDGLAWIAPLAAFVGQALDAGSKVLGICFGHQLLAHFFGGRTERASGWAVGVHESRVVAEAPWLQPGRERFALLSSHQDQVVRLPEGAELIATNDFCPIAGFVWGRQALAFQGHPEFSKPYAAALMDQRREDLGEATYRAGQASLARDIHPQAVARWMLNFCRG